MSQLLFTPYRGEPRELDLELPDGFTNWPQQQQDLYIMRAEWLITATTPSKFTPPGDWRVWLCLCGRGWGKTRTAAEDVSFYALSKVCRIEVVAPTFADVRDTCFEGESGILNCLPRRWIDKWNRSVGECVLKTGTLIKGFAGAEPNRLRGPQFHRCWVDELAAMPYADEVWMQIEMNCRLKPLPQIVVTTTPQKVPILRDLVARSERRWIESAEKQDARKVVERVQLAQIRPSYLDAACV